MSSSVKSGPIPAGRLQRGSSSSDNHISKFRQVLIRHGLTMTVIANICLFAPFTLDGFNSSLDKFFILPSRYFVWFLGVALFIFGYLKFTKKYLNVRQIAWISYLFLISVVEEIGFRLGLPLLFTSEFIGIDTFWIGVILSNLIFALIHYFTLRWKITACVFTFLGGMGFSRLFSITDDLALVILIHWTVTFLNTPSAPKGLNNLNLKN
jgi:hypothetical protein